MRAKLKLIVCGSIFLACSALGAWAGPRLGTLYAQVFPKPAYTVGDYAALHAATGKRVVVFTTSTCPYCAQTRALLAQERVDYIDFVVDRSPAADRLFQKMEEPGVPVLIVGDRKIVGFRQDTILQALATLKPPG